MKRTLKLEPPFFEIGPKNYLYGDQILDLARIADEAAAKYDVRVIFTTPYANIERVANSVKQIKVFAPHMDDIPVGRGLASILPESIKTAGAVGVMLNHAEHPLTTSTLVSTLKRARDLNLMSIVCADSMLEVQAVSNLHPDMMIAEPAELIGTGEAVDLSYVAKSCEAVLKIDPNIGILVGGGISSGEDVYNIIMGGADATGSSSGIVKAKDPEAMVHEMLSALRMAWDERQKGGRCA
ncbi:MAG: triose-phosphate isomerase [Lachnospiraceae bacterium]|jgi:triosephosphate isomerase|nr:triose-phosphate isomerase [Lachnospiraceae bacterium]